MAVLLACGVACSSARAASAGPGVYSQVLSAYQSTGTVAPCQFSSAQLQQALKGIDTYGAQYFSDFATAVQSALSQRAGGACRPGAAALLSRIKPRNDLHQSALAPLTAATSAGVPLPILLMGVLAMLGLCMVGTLGLWRWSGASPDWASSWRHAWGEAGHRAGALWLDFGDWRRSGR